MGGPDCPFDVGGAAQRMPLGRGLAFWSCWSSVFSLLDCCEVTPTRELQPSWAAKIGIADQSSLWIDMSQIDNRLKELGLELPPPPKPAGNYVPVVKTGSLLYVSGMLALRKGEISHVGPVGDAVSVDEAYQAAQVCALNSLAAIHHALGNWEALTRFILINGFVYAVPGFSEAAQVINGASDLVSQVFGERGQHARAAVAVSGLPKGSAVELQMTVEVTG